MKRFYQDFLGLSYAGNLLISGFSVDAYRFGNSTLKLTLPPEGMQPSPRDPDFKNGYISVRVTDAEAVVKEAEKTGVKIVFPLNEDDVGKEGRAKNAFVVDPMGNLIELVEMLEGKLPWE
jgi:catechol 2,3-dioxygenase-like lactoylglutathione lyase family enzyme